MGQTLEVNSSSLTTAIASGLDIGSQFTLIFTGGSGSVTIARSGSETINGANSVAINNKYSGATFIKMTSTAWYAVGDLV